MTISAVTNPSVNSQTSTAIVLSWTVGVADHYDIYRATSSRAGYWGAFEKVNSSPVAYTEVGYTDSSITKNTPYCYIVYSIDSDGSMIGSSPVWAVGFDGYNSTGLIYDALKSRVASTLTAYDSLWAEATRVVENEQSSMVKIDKRYSILVGSGEPVPGCLRAYDTEKTFTLNLSRVVKEADKTDADLQTKIKGELSELLEKCYVDILRSKLGLPSIVVRIERPNTLEPQYLPEQHAIIMSATIKVTYRVNLG